MISNDSLTHYSLPSFLLELGLAHKLSWQDAEAILDAYEAARQPDALDMLLAGWSPPPAHTKAEIDAALVESFKEWGRQFWGTPREAALMVWYAASCKSGGRDPGQDPKDWWGGANAREAFLLDLDSERNPGDHSKLFLRSEEQLLADVAILDSQPDTRWKRERLQAIIAERKRRHQ
jgi:hypothetical protein